MTLMTPQGLQADLMRQGFMKRRGKMPTHKVTAARDADGILLHPDSRTCVGKREADRVAKEWTAKYGVKFIVEKMA